MLSAFSKAYVQKIGPPSFMDNLKFVVFIDLINVRFELYRSKPLATIQWFLPNFPGFGTQVGKSTFLILAALTFSWPPMSLKVSPP